MSLNRKGYLTVDVILASVVAVTIAFFLIEITMSLVDITDNVYANTELLTDKALVLKNIKGELEKDIEELGGVQAISTYESKNNVAGFLIEFCDARNEEDNRIILFDYDSNTIRYLGGEDYDHGQYTDIYSRELRNYLYEPEISYVNNAFERDFIIFKVLSENKFSGEDFSINIYVHNNKSSECR